MISVIHEHSVDLDLLPKQANILDMGCRGFLFTKAMRELGHKVWPVDIDRLYESQAYYEVAISNYDGYAGVCKTNDPQATSIIYEGKGVPCYTLETFTKTCGLERWDLIKMDVEGSEYDIIMDQVEPLTKQWSIEFHLHTGTYGIELMSQMEQKLESLGYKAVSHKYTTEHGAGFNYWDSLFILK